MRMTTSQIGLNATSSAFYKRGSVVVIENNDAVKSSFINPQLDKDIPAGLFISGKNEPKPLSLTIFSESKGRRFNGAISWDTTSILDFALPYGNIPIKFAGGFCPKCKKFTTNYLTGNGMSVSFSPLFFFCI